MGDLVNPYANPYLPSFVNQRPVMNNPGTPAPQMNLSGVQFSQIHSAKGFEGARAWASNLANGASEIIAEEDPNLSRVYVVAKDTNGQPFIRGFDLTEVEEPKPVTMDDLSSTMNQILERLNKLEGERTDDQSIHGNARKDTRQPYNATAQPNSRNGQSVSESSGVDQPNGTK